jgi:hypothetical protein
VLPTTTIALDVKDPASWPFILTFGEVCQVLRISERVGHKARQDGAFPVPELQPRIGRRPRYYRDDVLTALRLRSGQSTIAERRKAYSFIKG